MKPNFLVIGAGKCGTSSLCYYLSQHPDVFLCEPKEPGFFSETGRYARGLEWYEALFREAQDHQAVGEGTVNYSKAHQFPHAAERIIEHLPDTRLIYIVRHPLERMISEWRYRRLHDAESLPFNQAIVEKPDYIETSRYGQQLDVFRKHYPDDRILVLFMEDMRTDVGAVLSRCLYFLDVGSMSEPLSAEAQNVGLQAIGTTRIIRCIRRLPGFETARQLVSPSIKRHLRQMLGRRMSDVEDLHEQTTWDPATLEHVRHELEAQSRAFCEAWGKPTDFWDFSQAPGQKSRH